MPKALIFLLIVSTIAVNVIDIALAHRFLGFYYILWVGGVGWYIWRHKEKLEERLVAWNMGGFKKFLLLGIIMILIEETFAGFSLNLGVHTSLWSFVKVILQCYALNLFALPGFIIAWYILLRKVVYTRKEVFVLVGLFGLYSEKIYTYVFVFPLAALFLILPTMFTYAVIIAPSIMSFRGMGTKTLPSALRYTFGLILPFIVSVPFIGVLFILMKHFPGAFPLEFIH
jgi:hypothetical protein